jgi:hypothetical protein
LEEDWLIEVGMELSEQKPKVVAKQVIGILKESGEWDALRVDIGAELRSSEEYKKTKNLALQLLATKEIKTLAKLLSTTEYTLIAHMTRAGVFESYKQAARQCLTPDQPLGKRLKTEVERHVLNETK